MNAIKYTLPLLLLALWGCDDNEPPNESSADPYINDLELVDYNYSIDTDPDDPSIKIVDVEYTIKAESKPVEDVVVDFYLLPSENSESSTLSIDDHEEYELDESEFKLLAQFRHSDLNAGSNVLSEQFAIEDVTLLVGDYELIPIVDPLGVYADSTPENNLPTHIAHEEPIFSEDGVVTIGDDDHPISKFESQDIDSVNIDESDIEVKEELLTANTVEPIVIDYTKENDFDYLPYFPPHEIGYDFTYRNEFLSFDNGEDRHLYVMRVYAMLNNEPNPLKIWNEEEQNYCYSKPIYIEDNGDHHIGFTTILNSEFDMADDDYLFNWVVHYKSLISENDTNNEVEDIEFIMTLLPTLEATDDCDEVEWGYDNPDAKIHKFTSAIFMNYVEKYNPETMGEPLLMADFNASETPPQGNKFDLFKVSKAFNVGSANTVKIALNNDVTLSYKSKVSDTSKDIKYGVFSTSSLDATLFNQAEPLTAVNFDIGISGAGGLNHNLEFNIKGLNIYVSSPDNPTDCDDTNCNAESFKRGWKEDVKFAKADFFIGPVPLSVELGAIGSLDLDFKFGFNPNYDVDFEAKEKVGALYLGGDLLVADLDAYLRGGLDLKWLEAGPIVELDLVNFKANVTGFIVPWADSTPYAAAYSKLDLSTMNGYVGFFADVTSLKWCSKKRWGVRLKYPCGKKTKKYRYWVGRFKSPYNYQEKEIFNTGKVYLF